MNIWDIIDYTRAEILDDMLAPYKWENAYLIKHLNRAYEELCREAKCLIDSTTVSVCQVNLLSNLGQHSLHPKILYVFEARRQSDEQIIYPKTEAFMRGYNWRTATGTPYLRIMDTGNRIFTVYPKFDAIGYIVGGSDIDFVDTTGVYTIEQSGATFTGHFADGDTLVVTGTTLNNGTFTITDVTDTVITVSEAVTGELNTSGVLRKIRDVALLRVARLPLIPWTLGDLEGATPPSPEIDETYHMGLSDGIAQYAFKKQDTETYDPEMAAYHAGKFTEFKSQVAWDMAQLMEGDTMFTPHYGTL